MDTDRSSLSARRFNVALTLVMTTIVVYGETSAGGQCWNLPPGVRWMVKGVDITKLDVLPFDITRLNGYKSPVLNLTCTRERKWTNGGKQYNVPDQVWSIVATSRGLLPSDVQIYKTSADVRNSMQQRVGGKGSIWKFSFSDSPTFKDMQNSILKLNRFISDTSAVDPVSRVDLIPYWDLELNKYAREYLEEKIQNTSYTQNPSAYHGFINQFGTHFFSVANFGGSIRVLFQTESEFYLSVNYNRTDEEIRLDALTSFEEVMVNIGSEYPTDSPRDTYNVFDRLSSTTIKFFGGDTTHLTSDGIQAWQPTINGAPWLISGQLQPISDLIRDDTQRTGLENAVEQYILRRYLGELRRLLGHARTKFGEAINGLETRLTALEGLPSGNLVVADLETLQTDIDNAAEVPDWFLYNTKLCYKWSAYGYSGRGQCNSSTDSYGSDCENVGQMTPWYLDNTDSRVGGCQMQWRISSSVHEKWFKEVQICYRWLSGGVTSQCNNKASGIVCAAVNDYTTSYRDATDNTHGGCKMSWRIALPTSAPTWIKQLNICFSWYPTGNVNQCGGPAPSRYMCAKANEWTPYYLDNTHGLHGGCQMRWGLKFNF